MVNKKPMDDWMTNLSYDPTKTPEGFDYQNYLKINTDLGAAGIDTPEEAMRHYQNYGMSENRNIGALQTQQNNPALTTNTASSPAAPGVDDWMADQWYNPNVMPQNFDWQRYVGANQDLGAAGIDTQEEAMRHYFNYGQQEGRNINAATPTRFEDLSKEDKRAGIEAYRQATGFDDPFIITNPGQDSSNHPVYKWINENYIPQGQLKTDYSVAKPAEKFGLLDTLETSNRPPEHLANIRKAWDANKDTPAEMRRIMLENGITLGDLSQATGETYSKLNTWVEGGDFLGLVGFRVNRPGAYEAYRGEVNPAYDPNEKFTTGPSTSESRLASYEASQKRAPNTFDPVAYAKDPEGYVKQMREQGGLAGLVADKAVQAKQAAPSTGQTAVKITPANFKSEYERISADPNLTEDQMRDFITSSLQDPTIKTKLGGQLQPVLDELSRPPRERMQDQIGAQQKIIGGQYYQGAYGDPKAMIDVLEKKGVKSLADIGQKDKFEAAPAEKRYFAKDGTPLVYAGSQGVYGELDPDGGIYNIVPKDQVRTEYGYINNELRSGPDGDYYEPKFVPLSEKDVDKDGNYQKLMGKVAFNKRTGEEISDVNGQIAARSTGNVITRKNNSLNIQFTKDGVPVLTASKQRAGLGGLAQKLAPMLSMALPFVMPGIGAALSKGLAGIGGSALATGSLANAALTRGLMSGGISALGGGKFGKGFLAGAASPLISSGIGSLLPAGLSENATNAIRSAGTGVVGNVLQGGNFKDALGEGVIGGLTNYGFNEATKGLDLTPQQVNIASNIAAPLIRGKKVDPMKLFRTAMMQAYEQERQNKRPTQKKADGGLLEGPAPVKVPGNASGMDPRMFTGIAANLMARSM